MQEKSELLQYVHDKLVMKMLMIGAGDNVVRFRSSVKKIVPQRSKKVTMAMKFVAANRNRSALAGEASCCDKSSLFFLFSFIFFCFPRPRIFDVT